jgi:D-amino-acid dehydrogenase
MADVAAKRKVTVIGAGIVGMASAVHLQRDGHDVTVVDRVPPGDGCSFGNAGIFATASMIPVSTPGLIWDVPKYLIDPLGPLSLRWSYLPRMIPWLVSFLRNGSPARMARIADALSTLLAASVEAHQRLAAGTGAERWIRPSPYILAYKNKAAFETDRRFWEMRRERGARYDLLDSDALRQIEPALAHDFSFAVHLHDHGHALDPARLVKALADHFMRQGGTVLERDVTDIEVGPDGPTRLLTSEGPLDIDVLVIAAGAWSARLTRRLGDKVPLEAERGYHITIRNPGVAPTNPIASAKGKFVATPMEPGLRVAGLVEFGGLEAPPTAARHEALLAHVRRMFPGVDTSDVTTWMGHRPSLPDSLPVIGPSSRFPSVFYAFGHQHVGLTGGPRTGELIADLIGGRTPNIDLAPFSVSRF